MMDIVRNENGRATLRVKPVNRKTKLNGEHQVNFSLLVHPARPPESGRRKKQWLTWPADVLESASPYRELTGAVGADLTTPEKDTIDL